MYSVSKLGAAYNVCGIRETGTEHQSMPAALSVIRRKDEQSERAAGMAETPVEYLDLQPASYGNLGK